MIWIIVIALVWIVVIWIIVIALVWIVVLYAITHVRPKPDNDDFEQ